MGPKILLMREMWNKRKKNKLLQGRMCAFVCVCVSGFKQIQP